MHGMDKYMKQSLVNSSKKRYTVLKSICVGSIILMCLLLASCSKAGSTSSTSENKKDNNAYTEETNISKEAKAYNDAVDAFFAALDSGDREAACNVFSASSQKADADLDEQIRKLMEVYLGPTDYCGRNGNAAQESGLFEDGKRILSSFSTFPVISAGKYYWCSLTYMCYNDSDSDQVGVTSISFYSGGDFLALANSGNLSNAPGLTIHFDHTTDDDIRCINGMPCKYTSSGTIIDENEVKSFLETSNSFTEFTEHFGKPNASDVFYYYELHSEDGRPRYIELIAGNGMIFDVSIVNDIEWLENIWEFIEED